jgi:hypothetical protein
MLGEMMDACQHFFWNFLNSSRVILSAVRIQGVKRLLPLAGAGFLECDASLHRFLGRRDSALRRKLTPAL